MISNRYHIDIVSVRSGFGSVMHCLASVRVDSPRVDCLHVDSIHIASRRNRTGLTSFHLHPHRILRDIGWNRINAASIHIDFAPIPDRSLQTLY